MTDARRPIRQHNPARDRRRLRLRRHSRRAYIRSVYFLPSMATLGNAVCGFAAIYVAHLDPDNVGTDPVAVTLANHRFVAACYLVLASMIFDALDGRLARWARHTTDFGGQLDSLADVISFGAAPAMIALAVIKTEFRAMPDGLLFISRLIWAIGALYLCCAAMRLARFNVSNEHGEQHHFSFLGLPSPGAAAAVVGFVLMQQDLNSMGGDGFFSHATRVMTIALPFLVLATGLLMVSNVRYPHLINQHLRGKKSFGGLIAAVALLLALVVSHRYTIGIGTLTYALSAPAMWVWLRARRRGVTIC